ncbi:MAG: hypothetical protein J5867_11655 [Prevotella sp.]|nr:hypothetical protein [Prevotella sp.]
MSGDSSPHVISNGASICLGLDELVDYAKTLDNKEDAEVIELMLYRIMGSRLTPNAIEKIGEIREHFKPKPPGPHIGLLVNNGTINDVHNNQDIKQSLAI